MGSLLSLPVPPEFLRHILLVDVERTSTPGAAKISLFGELDALNVGELHNTVVGILRDRRPTRIDLDLGGLTFLDTGGLKALLSCRADAERAGAQIRLGNPQPLVRRVLQAVGLSEVFGLTVT